MNKKETDTATNQAPRPDLRGIYIKNMSFESPSDAFSKIQH